MGEVVIRAEGLGKRYRVPQQGEVGTPDTAAGAIANTMRRVLRQGRARVRREEFWALRNASFELAQGEVLGIVGPNGAGKSTMLKLLARVTEPTEGRAEVHGRLGSLLEVGTGFHPDLSGRDNIYLNGAILGMTRQEITARFDAIVDFAGVERFLDMQVKHYSSGMYVRLAFAVAAHLEPEILLVDEVLSVGDQAFQDKCLGRMRDVTQEGRTVIFISHNMNSVASLCTRGLLVQRGEIQHDGPINETIERYLAGRPRTDDGFLRLDTVDRDGSGEVRFREVSVTNADGSPVITPDRGMRVDLVMGADRPLPGREFNVALGVNTILGERMLTLWTRFEKDDPMKRVEIEDGVQISCRIPELPLRPGRYYLTLFLARGSDVVDRVQNQVEFTVQPSDYYGTGVMPSESQGPLLVRQEWTAQTRATAPTP